MTTLSLRARSTRPPAPRATPARAPVSLADALVWERTRRQAVFELSLYTPQELDELGVPDRDIQAFGAAQADAVVGGRPGFFGRIAAAIALIAS